MPPLPPATSNDRAPLEDHQIWLLRADGLASLIFGLGLFISTGQSWWLFAWAILAPDLSGLGYLASKRIGAVTYNLAHSYLGPVLVMGLGWSFGYETGLAIGAIWWCHIGMDRAVGYGLKSHRSFKQTHLSFGDVRP